MTDLGHIARSGRGPSPRPGWALRAAPRPGDVQVVLAAIAAYEDETAECSSYVIDWETGLDPSAVDDVLDYLWMEDMIECRVLSSQVRHPSASDVRRVMVDRDRLWGPWGRYRGMREPPKLLGA